MATIDIADFDGARQTTGKYMPGTAAATASLPATLSNEDKTLLTNITTAIGGIAAGGDATAANQTTMIASLSVMDDWDETDRCKVNIIAGQAGVAGGAGASSALTQRMILATDDPGVTALQIMDDWDETDRCKVNIIAGQAGVAGGAGAVSALTQRVVLATDDLVAARHQAPVSFSTSVTRPNDTNVYAALDVIGASTGSTAAYSFASIGASGSLVEILGASLEIDKAAVISGETSYRLHFFSVTPPSALGDNGAFDLPSGDRASYLGYITLGVVEDLGATVFTMTDAPGKYLRMTGTGLFGYLQTVGGYTPAANTVYVLKLHTRAL